MGKTMSAPPSEPTRGQQMSETDQTLRTKKYLKERLKILRSMTGMTQDEFARHIGMTVGQYQAYEQGRNEPPISAVQQIAQGFGVTTSELMGERSSDDIAALIRVAPSAVLEAVKTILSQYAYRAQDAEDARAGRT